MTEKQKRGRAATRLNVLFEEAPAQATKEVVTALREAKGNLVDAALKLNIGERTLDRIIEAYPEIAKVAQKERAAAAAVKAAAAAKAAGG